MRFGERHRNRGDRQIGVVRDVLLKHLIHIHFVDVIATEHADILRLLVENQLQVLKDGVGRAAEPERTFAHLRRNDVDVLADLRNEAPRARDVLDQGVRLELRQNFELQETGIDEVVDDEVDDAVAPAEWNGRFRAIARQRIEPFAHASGEDHGQNGTTGE